MEFPMAKYYIEVVAKSSQQQVRQPLSRLHLERVWFYSLLDRRTRARAGGTARGVIDVRRQARKKIIVFGVH